MAQKDKQAIQQQQTKCPLVSLVVQRRWAIHHYYIQSTNERQTRGITCNLSYLRNRNSRTVKATEWLWGTTMIKTFLGNVRLKDLIKKHELLTSRSVIGWKMQTYCPPILSPTQNPLDMALNSYPPGTHTDPLLFIHIYQANPTGNCSLTQSAAQP